MNDLAGLIKEATASKSEIVNIDAPAKRYDYEIERRVGNSDKLYQYIHYRPDTSLQDGLKQVVEYIKKLK